MSNLLKIISLPSPSKGEGLGVRLSLLMLPLLLLLLVLNLTTGVVDIPLSSIVSLLFGFGEDVPEAWRFIVLESRLPSAITAACSGMALAVSGLLLQSVFRNPLAGPSVLGINSGASLAVSILLMLGSGVGVQQFFHSTFGGQLAIVAAAIVGSGMILLAIIALSNVVRSNVMLLIVGMMIGYLSSSVISILSYFSTEQSLRVYTIWGLGTFSNVSLSQLPALLTLTLIPLLAAFLYVKPLNAMLLGENYAANMGYDVKQMRNHTLIISCVLSAVVTAFCGPISFLGLAIPHIARLWTRTDNHLRLLPTTILTGANVALLCNLLSILPTNNAVLPINALTPLVGAPIIIWIVLRK